MNETLGPTVEWRPGSHVEQYMAIELLPEIMPGRYRMVLGLRDRLSHDHPVARAASGEELGLEVDLGEIVVLPSPWYRRAETHPAHAQAAPLAPDLELVGWGTAPSELYPGDRLDVVLYWHARSPARPDYDVELSLLDALGPRLRRRLRHFRAAYPSSPARGRATLATLQYWPCLPMRPGQAAALRVRSHVGRRGAGDDDDAGEVAVRGRLIHAPQLEHPQRAVIGEQIRLPGVDLTTRPAVGGVVDLTLYWQALTTSWQNYTVFPATCSIAAGCSRASSTAHR